MRQVLPARPQAAVQAVRALTPSPGRSRIRVPRIRNEINSPPLRRAPNRGVAVTLILLVGSRGCSRQNAAARKATQNGVELKRPLTNFLLPRQRLAYPHAKFFAVCHAAVAKLSFLITGPPCTGLCKDGLRPDRDVGGSWRPIDECRGCHKVGK